MNAIKSLFTVHEVKVRCSLAPNTLLDDISQGENLVIK